MTKALLVQSHGEYTKFVDRLIELLGDNSMCWDAARLLGELGGSDLILTKRNHAVLKVG